jgi:Zn-dependent M28 family amino/carboxypeptidase
VLPPFVQLSRAAGRAILGDASLENALAGGKVKASPAGVTARLRVVAKEEVIVSRNVIGIIPGSDPLLRDEAVVIGAHLDHFGTEGDVVYYGADDNASGVSALVEIAKALGAAQRKPSRTVVVCFWTGEEEGKFGSGYYVRHPRWPLAKTAAYLNLDMIGHPWLPEEIR